MLWDSARRTLVNSAQWPIAGHDLSNTRTQPAEHALSPTNVHELVPHWVYTTGSDVSATPTVYQNTVYFPDWAGNLYAVNRLNGHTIWSTTISSYTGVAGAMSRVSPAVYGEELILGDNQSTASPHNGAHVFAVDRTTGGLLWITQVDTHPAAIITGPAVVYNGVIYQGVSSNEEALANVPGYPCCTFRGSMVALDATTGRILWKTYDVPNNGGQVGGYSGGAIWQPPAIDPGRGALFVGTGNNYTVPASVATCQANTPGANCTAPDDYFETALSLELNTGAIHWAHRISGYDAWTVACTNPRPGVTCPSPAGPDYDLGGSGPNLVGNIVGFGQKSGIYWAFNPDNGNIVWDTIVGPGGLLGGIEWGTATDGKRIYAAISNSYNTPYTLINGRQISRGSWSALDVATGKILWQTADPTQGAIDPGAVSEANGVVYAGSYDTAGHMYALNAATGAILWSFASGGSVIDGPSIVSGFVYWGSGFRHIAPGTGNNKVYAFSLPD